MLCQSIRIQCVERKVGKVGHQVCQHCHKNPATIHEYIVSEKKENHYCEECYSKLNEEKFTPMIHLELIQKLFFGEPEKEKKRKKDKTCETCGMRLSEFRKVMQFGCEDCYKAFWAEIKPILENIHDAKKHVGTAPSPEQKSLESPGALRREKEKLEKQLQICIKEERYEDAAKIRDKLKQLENKKEEKERKEKKND